MMGFCCGKIYGSEIGHVQKAQKDGREVEVRLKKMNVAYEWQSGKAV